VVGVYHQAASGEVLGTFLRTFFAFIDLRKAYDSVPREALWIALKKLGIPDDTVKLISSFHQGMTARIRLDGSLLEQFEVKEWAEAGMLHGSSLVQSIQLPGDREMEGQTGRCGRCRSATPVQV